MAENDSIRSISISVTTDTKTARLNIDTLVRSLQRLVDMVASLKTVGSSIDSMAKGLDALGKIDLRDLPDQMAKIAEAMKELTHLDFQQTRSLNAQARLLSAQNRQKELAIREKTAATEAEAEARKREMLRLGIFRTGSTKTGDTAEQWEYGKVSDSEKKANAELMAMQVRMASLGQVARDLGKVLSAMARVTGVCAKAFGKFAAAVGMTAMKIGIAPFKRLASSVKGLTKRFTNFFAAVKRIAIYRAIRTALKEIAQGFKEGMDNLYQYSKAINGQFAKSMDMIATSALYAKNSLGAMSAPIINTLAPALDMLVDKFVDVLNTINELIASMTGASTWTAALKYPKEYAEDLDSAAGSAKKLRATLLGFDEINRLDDNNKGSRGRAGEELDYSKMFEERTVSTQAKSIIQSLKDAFASGDLTELGSTIGETIKRSLDNIDWDSVKESFNKRATMLATFINGLVDVEGLGETLGKTIAEVFNVAVGKLNTFLTTVRWDKIGTFLGEGFNAILTTFDIGGLGSTIATIINNAVELLGNFINKVKWNKVGEFLSDGIDKFFNAVNTKELARTICNGLIGALQAVSSLLRNTDFENIGKKVGEFLKGIKWSEVIFETISVILNAISAAARLVWGLIEELFGGIGRWFVDVFSGAWKGIKGAWNSVVDWFVGIYEGIVGAFKFIGNWFKDKFDGAKKNVTTAFAGVGGFFSEKANDVKSAFKGIGSWFSEKFTDAKDNVKKAFTGVGTFFSDLWEGIKGTFKDVGSWFYDKFTTAFKSIREALKGVTFWISELWSDVKESFSTLGSKVGTVIGNAFRTAVNGVLSACEKVLNAPIKAINEAIGVLNKLPGVDIGKIKLLDLPRMKIDEYAKGGYPDTGSIFIAGEKGAEIVSSYGGRTQVANRDQIASSVAIGMEDANQESNALLREQNNLLRSILAKDTTVVTNITTDTITNALDRQNRRNGRAIVPVGV